MKYSRQRESIKENLMNRYDHPTAETVYLDVKKDYPNISLGTVYRNLKLMEQAREIARLEMPDGPDRVDKTSNPHGHLYCDCCGSLQDLPVIGLVREIENAIGTEVRSYQLTIHYICPECREKQAEL